MLDTVTDCAGPYAPATGEKVGVATGVLVPVKFTPVMFALDIVSFVLTGENVQWVLVGVKVYEPFTSAVAVQLPEPSVVVEPLAVPVHETVTPETGLLLPSRIVPETAHAFAWAWKAATPSTSSPD